MVVTGGEGAGKSTVMAALLRQTPCGAKVDGEDIGQVNPFSFDRAFLDLLWSNLVAVIGNFWEAGYHTVIAGSFLDRDTHSSLQEFRARFDRGHGVFNGLVAAVDRDVAEVTGVVAEAVPALLVTGVSCVARLLARGLWPANPAIVTCRL